MQVPVFLFWSEHHQNRGSDSLITTRWCASSWSARAREKP